MYEAAEKSPTPRALGEMHTFHIKLHGLWNGFILETGHLHLGDQRSFAIQLAGDSEEEFETVIEAIRDAYAIHRAQKDGR